MLITFNTSDTLDQVLPLVEKLYGVRLKVVDGEPPHEPGEDAHPHISADGDPGQGGRSKHDPA